MVASILCNKAVKGWTSEPDEVAPAVAVAVEVAGSKVLSLAFDGVSAPAAGIPALADMPTDEPTPGPNILAAIRVGPRPKKEDELLGKDEEENPFPEEDPPVPNDDDEDEDELPIPISKDVDEPPTPPPTPKDEAGPPMPTPNTEVPLSLTNAVPFPNESSPYGSVPVRFGVARDRKGWFVVVAAAVVGVYIVFESKVPKAVTDVVVG